MNQDKIIEQFRYFNIQADIDSVYGNWAVSKNGDVVNHLYPYVIMSIHLYDCDWIEEIRKKVWFKSSCEVDMKQALDRAIKIHGNKN